MIVGLAGLAGCTNPSNVRELAKEIAPLKIGPALTPRQAFDRLQAKGFVCSAPKGQTGYYECVRDKTYFVLNTCSQRVGFHADAPNKAIRSVEPLFIPCGGM
jgi:hypothetical protein